MVADDDVDVATIDRWKSKHLGFCPPLKAREDGRRDLWRDGAPADQCLKGRAAGRHGADNCESLNLRRFSACGLMLPVKLTLSGPSLPLVAWAFPSPANLRCQARLPVCAELARPPSHRSSLTTKPKWGSSSAIGPIWLEW